MPTDMPWRYADRQAYRELQARRFSANATAYDDQAQQADQADQQPAPKPYLGQKAIEQGGGGNGDGGFFGSIGDAIGGAASAVGGAVKDAGSAIGTVASDALSTAAPVLGAAQRYIGEPAVGVLTGAAGMQRKPIYDAQGNITGYKREGGAGLLDYLTHDLPESVAHPGRAGEAFREYEKSLPLVGRAAASAVSDPLSYVGPGLAGKVAEFAGLSGKGATVAEHLLNQGGGGTVLGAHLGGQAEAQYGDQIPGWNELPPEVRSLIAGIAGGAAGGASVSAIRRIMANPAVLEAVKNAAMAPAMMATGAVPGGTTGGAAWKPKVELANLPHDVPTLRPDLFQARDVPPGEAFDETRVNDLMNTFDPTKVVPGLIAKDTNSGEQVVVSGHHRLEVLKRQAAAGQYPDEAQWRVVNADLNNPEHVDALKRLAVIENYTTGATNLRADLNAYSTLKSTGMDMRDIAGEIGRPLNKPGAGDAPSVQDLDYLSVLPKDIIDRLVQEPGTIPLAAEVARAARAFDLNDTNVRSLLKRYGPGGESSGLTRTQLRSNLELAGQHLQMNQAQQGLWGDEPPPILKTIDAMKAKERELAAEKAHQIATQKGIAPYANDPEAAASHTVLKGKIDDRITAIEQELAGLRADYQSGRGTAPVPGGVEPVLEPDQPPAPLAGQAGLPGDNAAADIPAAAVAPTTEPAGPGTALATVAPAPEATLPPEQPPTALKARLEAANEPPPPGELPPPDAGAPNATPPLDRTNPHTILGLDPNIAYTDEELTAAYRAQAHVYHPDINANPTATADMQAVNAALETLLRKQVPGPWANTRRQTMYEEFVKQTDQDIRGEQQRYRDETRARAGVEPPPPDQLDPGRYRHFGENDRFSLFDKFIPQTARSVEMRRQATVRGQLENIARNAAAKTPLGSLDPNLTLDTQVRPIVSGLKNDTNNAINHFATQARERAESALSRAGIDIGLAPDGNYHINSDVNLPPIEDVIERSSPAGKAYYDNATPEQRNAFDFIEKMNEIANKTIEAHGGTLPYSEQITGTYFPRKVSAIGDQERTSGGSSYRRSRTLDSLEEGTGRNVADGGQVVYQNPMDSFEAGLRGKLRTAQDSLMVERLKQYAVAPDSAKGIRPGFGYENVPLRGYDKHPLAPDLLFPQPIADRIKAGLNTPPVDNLFTKIPKAINSVLTPLRATGDLSATMQQGMAAWLRNPVEAGKMWTTTVASLHDPDVYFRALDKIDAEGPGMVDHVRWGAHVTNGTTDGELLLPKVAAALSGGKYQEIPGLGTIARKSNEHFSRFLNLIRFGQGNDAWQSAVAQGLTGKALDDHMLNAWKAINRATGWTGRRPSTLEQVAAFAPRYLSSNIEQINSALTKGGIEGTLARQHLGRLVAAGAGITWMVNTARGYNTDWDPRSSNFMRIRNIAGLDITPLGSYDTIVRAVAGTAFGNNGAPDITRAARFLEGKLSPALKIAEEIGKGRTYLGEPLDVTTPGGIANAAWQETKSSLPFTIQDLAEGGPLTAAIGSTGLSARLESPTQTLSAERDHAALAQFGKAYADLTGDQKSHVNEGQKVVDAQANSDAQAQRQGGDNSKQVDIRQLFQQRMAANAKYLAAGQDDAGQAFTGKNYRSAYHDLQQYIAGARSTLKGYSNGDATVNGWFDLYKQAEMANGQLDFNKLDALQTAYSAAHPDAQTKADQLIGIHDDATLREFRQAQQLAQQYYNIPGYLGMNAQDSQTASGVLAMASQLVSLGHAPDRETALYMLAGQDRKGVMLALTALDTGTNPARHQFQLKNPLFTKFYA